MGGQKRPRVYLKCSHNKHLAIHGGLLLMTPRYTPHFTLSKVHRQPVTVVFDAPDIVSDTGLLTVRDLDQRLGYLADLARRLPDPRAQAFVTHRAEEILAQQVYQLLADYADCNDADALRRDPLFH